MARTFSTLTALAILAAPSFAAAQSNEEPQAQEIVITAQKREQALSEVPINVTAFSGNFLDQIGVEKFDELAEFVPGLQIQEQSANNPAFVIRGITSDSGETTTEPRVAIFQDGVSLSRSRGSYVELFDLERVEVAKGPQATLFGRSALIGGVNLIQNKASFSGPAIQAEALAGDEGQASLAAALNGIVVEDQLAVRLAGRWRERDGFVTNLTDGSTLGDVQVGALRGSVRLDPTENLRFDLIVNHQKDEASGTPFVSNRIANSNGDIDLFDAADLNTFGGFEGGRPLGLERDVNSLTLLAAWDINDSLTLTSITGAREFDSVEIFDPDGSALPLFVFAEDATGEQLSQEIRLNWDNGGRVSWFAGASYFQEEGSQRVPVQFDERIALALLTGQLQATFPTPSAALFQSAATASQLLIGLSDLDGAGASFSPLIDQTTATAIAGNLLSNYGEYFINSGETESFDAYADLTFAITPKLELSAGIRYTLDDKTSTYFADINRESGVQRSVLGTYFGGYQIYAGTVLALNELLLAGQLSPTDFGDALADAQADFQALAGALAVPNASFIPESVFYPIPNAGL